MLSKSSKEITPSLLRQCILRDPASWSGLSLLYLRPADKRPPALKMAPETLMLRGKRNDYLLLGERLPDTPPPDMDAHVWIRDIAAQWQHVSGILDAMATKSPSPIEDTAQKLSTERPSILIVEDDAATSLMVTQHLRKFGPVVATSNARQAVASWRALPDLPRISVASEQKFRRSPGGSASSQEKSAASGTIVRFYGAWPSS